MAKAHLDHPGNVTWFAGYGPVDIVGPCPHQCEHLMLRTVAWGPDYDHYSLLQCDDNEAGGCAGECRGWSIEYPHPFTEGPKFKLGPLMQVEPSAVSGWWAVSAATFLAALQRCEAGESAALVYAEHYANSRVER